MILTSSREERDLAESYGLGVNSYVVKPVDFDRFSKVAKDLDKRFGLTHRWKGDEVSFNGAGVSGSMHVGKSQISLDVELSFLFVALKGTIERHINRELDAALKGNA